MWLYYYKIAVLIIVLMLTVIFAGYVFRRASKDRTTP